MRAYRIYHIEDGKKNYICNRPELWLHISSDPEYAIPFLEKEKAEKSALFAAEYVAPKGKRFVEEYKETRKLVRYLDSGQIILAEMFSHYTHIKAKYELIG